MNEVAISLITRERAMLAVAACLAVLVPIWLLSGNGEVPETSAMIGVTPFKTVPIEQPADALAAPLFNAEREAPPIDEQDGNASQAAVAVPPAAVPSLVGLIVGRSMPGLALARGADGQTHLLHAGDALDGWQVLAISSSGVTFDMEGHSEKVGLNFVKAAGREPSAGSSPPASFAPDMSPNKPVVPGQPLPSGIKK